MIIEASSKFSASELFFHCSPQTSNYQPTTILCVDCNNSNLTDESTGRYLENVIADCFAIGKLLTQQLGFSCFSSINSPVLLSVSSAATVTLSVSLYTNDS